jgi:hypothetical protein
VLERRRLNHPFLIGVDAFKVFYNGIREGSQFSHQKCALPNPKLQSSLLFAEQVTIRSVPGTPQSLSNLRCNSA